jgi:hypothetical protein
MFHVSVGQRPYHYQIYLDNKEISICAIRNENIARSIVLFRSLKLVKSFQI